MALKTPIRNIRQMTRCTNLSLEKCRMTTAGILVIGDEILKGEVVDTNTPCVTKTLHGLGVKVKKISVIGDDVVEICKDVRDFSEDYDYVITSGGIGPTHDDVTFEGVANAFGVRLKLNPVLAKLCQAFYKTCDDEHPGMKLAKIPDGSNLFFTDDISYPNVSIKNVYLFPGIPELFLRSFNALAPKLFRCQSTFYQTCVYVNIPEHEIAGELDSLVSECPEVQVGSYPKLYDQYYKVKITMESTNEIAVKKATKKLLEKLPMDCIVTVENR